VLAAEHPKGEGDMFVQTLPQPAQRLLERMTGVTEKKMLFPSASQNDC
jgi:hypothetical protein